MRKLRLEPRSAGGSTTGGAAAGPASGANCGAKRGVQRGKRDVFFRRTRNIALGSPRVHRLVQAPLPGGWSDPVDGDPASAKRIGVWHDLGAACVARA